MGQYEEKRSTNKNTQNTAISNTNPYEKEDISENLKGYQDIALDIAPVVLIMLVLTRRKSITDARR